MAKYPLKQSGYDLSTSFVCDTDFNRLCLLFCLNVLQIHQCEAYVCVHVSGIQVMLFADAKARDRNFMSFNLKD